MTDTINNFLVFLIFSFQNGQTQFTNLDINVIGHLNKYLNAQCVVFVKDSEDLSAIKGVKTLPGYNTIVDSTSLENILGNNISQFRFLQRKTVIVTKEELNLTSLLSKVSFPHHLTWVIFKDYNLFTNHYIPVSNEVLFINSTPESVSVNRVLNLKSGVEKTVTTVWSWNLTQLPLPPFGFKIFKMNFHNVSLDLLVLTPSEGCLNMHKKMLLKKIECFHQDFLQSMGRRLNFSINFVECIEKEHPFTYPNGSESELFLRLKHHEVDFSAISHVVLARGGRNYIDFVWPTFVLKGMMYLKQGRMTGRWDSYIKPLESSVWWGILIWIIVTGILIHIFEKMLMNNLKFDFSHMVGLVSSMLQALQVFCNQAMVNLSTFYSIRIIYFSEFFVVLIFFQAYCGYLISSLTVVVPEYPFRDLEGLFENKHYQVMTLRNGFQQFFFRKIIGEGRRDDFMLPRYELPETLQSAIDRLCTHDHLAFPEFKEDFLNFDTLKCNILQLPSPVVTLFVGIAMPKPSPLKEYLRRELLHLKSAGLVERLRSRLSFQTNFWDKNSQDEFVSVSMTQIFSIFILLGMGILLSSFIFIVELCIEKKRRRRLQ